MPKGLRAKEIVPSRVHVIFGESPDKRVSGKTRGAKAKAARAESAPVVKTVALIVKEVDGKVVSTTKIFAR